MQSDVTWEQLEHLARREGLDMVGVVPAGPAPTWDVYRQWLAQGYAGDMTYLTRPDALSQRADPRTLMPSARSVLIVGTGYAGPSHPSLLPLHGRVSRYAWQEEDYHRWLLRQLKALVGRITEGQAAATSRCYVDTGPVLERAWAQAAGLGWFGKHSNLIHPRLGSYVFLGVALLDVDLPSTPAIEMPGCGACTRCIEACPTGAIIAPGVVDARRCLSYLTIENRGPIPEALRAAVGSWVFGC
ncbi:MAG: tRNA epoxyqueuosine(34) reductase QueG, partial [Anaerolineae bacterium]|nr:tRNA epoxyqueuosine(34) reductase QueG [Anaerolineae bacterium]